MKTERDLGSARGYRIHADISSSRPLCGRLLLLQSTKWQNISGNAHIPSNITQIKVYDLDRRPVDHKQAQYPVPASLRVQPIPVEQRLPRIPLFRLPHDLPVAEVARGGAAEDAEPRRVDRVVGQNKQDGAVRGLRRGDDLTALADDGGRAGDVVDALEL